MIKTGANSSDERLIPQSDTQILPGVLGMEEILRHLVYQKFEISK